MKYWKTFTFSDTRSSDQELVKENSVLVNRKREVVLFDGFIAVWLQTHSLLADICSVLEVPRHESIQREHEILQICRHICIMRSFEN